MMFGSDAFSSVPFADGAEVFDYYSALADQSAQFVYTLELTVWNVTTNVASILRFASIEWATLPTDYPGSQAFDGRLSQPLSISRSLIDSSRLGINYNVDNGTIIIDNDDGFYDTYATAYAVDSRRAVVRLGRTTDSFANHLVIFDGTVVDWKFSRDKITVVVQENTTLMNALLNKRLYGGTGGSDGGADLTGKRKPLTFGSPVGVSPVLVEAAKLIYQYHDNTDYGFNCVVSAFYDRGVLLTNAGSVANYAALSAAVVSAGEYKYTPDGYLRLGASPAGVIFGQCDTYLVGTTSPTTSDVVTKVLAAHGFTFGVDSASIAAVKANLIGSGTVGIHSPSDSSQSVKDFFDMIMAGLGGWAGFNRRGLFEIGIFETALGVSETVLTLDYSDGVLIDVEIVELPSSIWPPPWRFRVANNRNYTEFDDFAASVPDLIKARYAEPYLLEDDTDAAVLVDHPNATDPPPIEAFFTSAFSANTEAGRLIDTFSAGYRNYELTVSAKVGLLMKLGDPIVVKFPRYGLMGIGNGTRLRVCEMQDRIALGGTQVDKCIVTAFG